MFALATAAASIRLLPWWLSRDVPLEVSLPFAMALLAASLEASLLVGVPFGIALALGVAAERGELRTLQALGASPQRIAASLWPVFGALSVIVLALGWGWDARSEPPGRFAQALVEEARTSCYGATNPRAVTVPMVNVTWLCFPGKKPKVVAPVPGGGGWIIAEQLTLSEDLRALTLREALVRIRAGAARPEVRVAVHDADLRGLPGWGRGTRLGGAMRGSLTALLLWVASLAAGYAIVRAGVERLAIVAPVGLLPPVSCIVAISRLDASSLPTALFWCVPALALAMPLLVVAVACGIARRWARGANGRALC